LFQPFPSAHKIYILKAETNFPESKWCVNNPEEEKHILPNPMWLYLYLLNWTLFFLCH
jgi:hypothetical protein